jgi:hypothetical protein
MCLRVQGIPTKTSKLEIQSIGRFPCVLCCLSGLCIVFNSCGCEFAISESYIDPTYTQLTPEYVLEWLMREWEPDVLSEPFPDSRR